jgi:riboflavin kinase/FMN adenylyltransferase
MRVIKDLNAVPEDLKGSVMTVGNFDGVHLAHQAIIKKVVGEAEKADTKAIVMTFDPHPQQVLHPQQKPFYLITSLEEKIDILTDLGVNTVIVVPFSHEFSKTTAGEFAKDIICGKFNPIRLFIGHDYTFGRGKEGKPDYLKALGEKYGFDVQIIGAVKKEGDIVSSTRVRNVILEGNVSLAARLLGRPYSLQGYVVEGDRRGRDIGFPTANIEPEKILIPSRGVYAVFVDVEGRRYMAAVNIGFNPTFLDGGKIAVEAHILDFKGHLYGYRLRLSFVQRIRDEQKFSSSDRLVTQIRIDVERTRAILEKH